MNNKQEYLTRTLKNGTVVPQKVWIKFFPYIGMYKQIPEIIWIPLEDKKGNQLFWTSEKEAEEIAKKTYPNESWGLAPCEGKESNSYWVAQFIPEND